MAMKVMVPLPPRYPWSERAKLHGPRAQAAAARTLRRAMAEFPPDDIAITTRQVMQEGWPVLLVTHDADDDAWQFLNGHGDTDDTESAMVIGAARILTVDSTIAELADLPLGWRAWRETTEAPWKRGPR